MTTATQPARTLNPVASYTAIGWTTKDWDDLYEEMSGTWGGPPESTSAPQIADWLCQPRQFRTPITPAQIRDLYRRRPMQAAPMLTALSMGAPEEFLMAVLAATTHGSNEYTLRSAWENACTYNLTGPQAAGWAAAGAFKYQPGFTIGCWVDQFGPDAYLYLLAGFTQEEATALKTAGTTPSEQQLKVMAALGGFVLPAGT